MESLLTRLGFGAPWDRGLSTWATAGERPARVAQVERGQVFVLGLEADGRWVPVRRQLRFWGEGDLPKIAVGDWALASTGPHPAVDAVLPRKSCLVRRKVQRRAEAQVLAANVDAVFIVTAFGPDFSLPRLERYVVAVAESGARPVVVINKVDATGTHGEAELERLGDSVDVCFVSAVRGDGLTELTARVEPGRTAAFVGSSGVGKSTLVNRFLGTGQQATQPVRTGDAKGRHTTTARQLFVTPSGRLLIDSPGVREFGVWDAEAGLTEVFDDVEALIEACRFSDCRHESEPGCAVRAALQDGLLSPARLENYVKIQREVAREAQRVARRGPDAKERWKTIHKNMKARRSFQKKHGLKD